MTGDEATGSEDEGLAAARSKRRREQEAGGATDARAARQRRRSEGGLGRGEKRTREEGPESDTDATAGTPASARIL